MLPRMRRATRTPLEIAALAAVVTAARPAHAEPQSPATSEPAAGTVTAEMAMGARPPPATATHFQYGFALTAEVVASAGAMCAAKGEPCVLGSGGGIAARVGYRPSGRLYVGGAYEVSKQDPESLLRLATLQQLRGELRYYLVTGRDTVPYLGAAAGLAAYGNELSFDTKGPVFSLAIGFETEISRTNVVGGALAYRMVYFTPFDLSGVGRKEGSFAHIFGLDVTLEVLDPR